MECNYPESREWMAVAIEVTNASLFRALPYMFIFLWPSPIICKFFSSISHMRNRTPSLFKGFFCAVNFIQVLLCSWVTFLVIDTGFFDEFGFFCQTSAHLKQKESKSALSACQYYYLSNLMALLDTAYMKIYGKKITFLHVYHHSSALVWSWIVSELVPGDHSLFIVAGISVAHIAIYLYYFLLQTGAQLNRNLCWTAITLLQMFLIAIGIIYMSMVYFYDRFYPKSVAVIYIIFSFILLLLFVNLLIKRQYSACITAKSLNLQVLVKASRKH